MADSSTESKLANSDEQVSETLDQLVSIVRRAVADAGATEQGCFDDALDEALVKAATELVGDMQAELDSAQRARDEFKTIAARAQADLINFRRRSDAERSEVSQRVREVISLKMCEIADEFAAALDVEIIADEAWLDGFRGIYKNLTRLLADEGYRRFDSLGLQADPLKHEVVTMIETDDADEGSIVQVIKEGYEHVSTGRVLRPALVVAAAAPSDDETD